MRLTCPNCSARYEVDESMIPPAGRDVQCSNCSNTWFQPGPRGEAPELEPPVEESPPPPPTVEDAPPAPPPPEPQRRPAMDPEVQNILREEAERESQLRRGEAEATPVETQDEMPLDVVDDDAPRSRRMADLEEAEDAFEEEDAIEAAVKATVSRRDLLPDIEEINSTLRATGDRTEGEADATDAETVGSASRRRSRVRLGFFLILALAAIAVGVYAFAPQIAEAAPAIAAPLQSYVAVVDDARFWLDDLARGVAVDSGS